MSLFDEFSETAKGIVNFAGDKAKTAAEITRVSISITEERQKMERNLREIGEWFISQNYEELPEELPEEIKKKKDAVEASKEKISELESQKSDAKSSL